MSAVRRLQRIVALLALALALLPWPALAVPPPGETWIEVTTDHFSLVSNAGERKTAEIGRALERFRAVLARLKPGLELNAPRPTTIVLFKNERSFAPYNGERGRGGYFISHRHGNFIGLNAFPDHGSALPVVYHEYVHFFVRHNYPQIPLWVNEGLAEYYRTLGMLGDEVQIGNPVLPHVGRLRRDRLIPFERFFAIDPTSPEYNDEAGKRAFYAQAWGLVHMFLSQSELRAGTMELLRLLDEGVAAPTALRRAFGFGVGELEERLRSYMRAPQLPTVTLRLEELAAPTAYRVRTLSRPEALFHLGNLLAHSGELEAAAEHFHLALALDERYADGYTGLAVVAAEQGRLTEAEEELARAVELGSSRALTYLLYGEVLLRQEAVLRRLGTTTDEPLWAEARRQLEHGAALAPGFAEIDVLLGSSYLLDPGSGAGGVPHLLSAMAKLPERRLELAHNLAQLYLKDFRLQEAEGVVEQVLRPGGDSRLLASAESALERTRLIAEANEALATGDAAAAVVSYRQAAALAPDAAAAATMGEEIARLEGMARRQRWVERYNHAVDAAGRGQTDVARREAEALLPLAEDPELENAANQLLRLLDGR